MNKLLLSIAITASLFTVSCAKEQVISNTDQSIQPGPEVEVPNENDDETEIANTNDPGFASLNTDVPTFEKFFKSSTNNVTDIKLKLDLRKNPDDTYSGSAFIYFTDRGATKYLEFKTGGQSHSPYNVWIKNDSQFHAIFDDGAYGMLVVTIDRVYDFGDGLGTEDLVEGSVFYHNYDLSPVNGVFPAGHPQTYGIDAYCWEHNNIGRYTCDPWDSIAHSKTQLWPNSNINVLGRFTDMSLDGAFNSNDNRR